MVTRGVWKRVVVSSTLPGAMGKRVRVVRHWPMWRLYHLYLRMSEGVGRGVCERVVVYAC